MWRSLVVMAFVSHIAMAKNAETAKPVGPFTADQALHGKIVYQKSCSPCHGPVLEGGKAPALAGAAFEARWNNPALSVDDLFYIVSRTMPPKAAATVSLADHAAATAYILETNGFSAGSVPMQRGMRELSNTKFPWAGKHTAPTGASAAPVDFVPADVGAAAGTNGPDQAALDAAARSADWLMHAHDYSGSRYSPLDEVNVNNVNQLTPICRFELGEKTTFQTGPIVHRGVMYLTTPTSTIALDAATCQLKWRHKWQLRGSISYPSHRGGAIKDGRFVRGTPDGYLLALSAESGAQLWARRVADQGAGETFTMAPIIYDDLVLIGPAGSELNAKGWVGAFRLSDGSPVWRFSTVPRRGEPAYKTWRNPKSVPPSGGPVWTSFSLDAATGALHIAVGNPAPDFAGQMRRGDNLYTNSIVTLNVRTGNLEWYKSLVPHDSHDWDLTHAMPLFTATVHGKQRRLVATAGKDGMLRVLDRDTHSILYGTPLTTIENARQQVTTTPTHVCPGALGGVAWSGPSYSERTRMLYTPAVDWCATYFADEDVRYIPGRTYFGGDSEVDPVETAHGWVTAIEATTGTVKWKYRSPTPMTASVTTTAGDLLLTGELSGDFLVLDARYGAELYRFNTGGAIGGSVVTYQANRRQYIAAASGSAGSFWVDPKGGVPTVVVFALPAQASPN